MTLAGKFTVYDDLRDDVEPLSRIEIAWCKKLARLLAQAPKRLMLSTTGDTSLFVYDGDVVRKLDLPIHDQHGASCGAQLGQLHGSIHIAGVSG